MTIYPVPLNRNSLWKAALYNNFAVSSQLGSSCKSYDPSLRVIIIELVLTTLLYPYVILITTHPLSYY